MNSAVSNEDRNRKRKRNREIKRKHKRAASKQEKRGEKKKKERDSVTSGIDEKKRERRIASFRFGIVSDGCSPSQSPERTHGRVERCAWPARARAVEDGGGGLSDTSQHLLLSVAALLGG